MPRKRKPKQQPAEPPHVRLRAWRETEGLSLVAAGEMFGCGNAWLSLIERGLRLPGSVRLTRAIERLTDIDQNDWPEAERKPRRKKNEVSPMP